MGRRRLRDTEPQSFRHERRDRRIRAGRRGTGAHRHRRREEGVSRVVDRFDPGARQHPRSRRQRDHRPQGRTRRAAVARGRQDAARGHRRSDARRADLQVLRRRSGAHDRRQAGLGAARRRRGSDARAAGRHRSHHAVELPDRDSGMEDRARARLRQHRRVQAGRPRARLRVGDRGDPRPRRIAGRRVQSRHGTRFRRRRGDRQPSRRHGDQLHRIRGHRPRHRGEGHRADGQAAAGNGRQESAGRARRRRPADGGQCRRAGLLFLDRAALHGVVAAHRHRWHPRPLRRRGRPKS